jgi:hypothetical protein
VEGAMSVRSGLAPPLSPPAQGLSRSWLLRAPGLSGQLLCVLKQAVSGLP